MIWAIVATGQSINFDDVDYLQGKVSVAAVSDAYRIAPWADCLVSHDAKWWAHHKEALEFSGRKFCRQFVTGTERFIPDIPSGCNSGRMAMDVVKKLGGAKKLILLGFDMHGTHYFGPHQGDLRNTDERRFKHHLGQFSSFTGCEVINCTPNSALTVFPMANLRDII